jgi:hypothetical protein
MLINCSFFPWLFELLSGQDHPLPKVQMLRPATQPAGCHEDGGLGMRHVKTHAQSLKASNITFSYHMYGKIDLEHWGQILYV